MGNPLDEAVVKFIDSKSNTKDQYVAEKLMSLLNNKHYLTGLLESNPRFEKEEQFRYIKGAITNKIGEINAEIGLILANNITLGEIKTETPITV